MISQIVKELVDLTSNSFPVILYMVKYIQKGDCHQLNMHNTACFTNPCNGTHLNYLSFFLFLADELISVELTPGICT